MCSGDVKRENIRLASTLVERAASTGADVVVLPEMWNVIGEDEVLHANAESIEDGESIAAMHAWAIRYGITQDGDRCSNTCVVFASDGSVGAVYRKVHLFDVEVGGVAYRESDAQVPGAETAIADASGWKVGLTICYDLRFPELYRIPLGAVAPGTRGREPVLRRRRRPVEHPPRRQAELRAVDDRRPVGPRARAGTGRRLRDHSRP
jgi:predicted amidohydrolase